MNIFIVIKVLCLIMNCSDAYQYLYSHPSFRKISSCDSFSVQKLFYFERSNQISKCLKDSLKLKSTSQPSQAISSNTQIEFKEINTILGRCAWLSWWIQITLSTICLVTLSFANTVRTNTIASFWSSGFAFSGLGVFISFINCAWTWNSTRLSRRIITNRIEIGKIFPTIRKYCQISVVISLVGLLFSLLGAEQIAGTLATKALTTQSLLSLTPQYAVGGSNTMNSLQALDIFLVQANTNCIVAHYAPLIIFLLLQTQLPLPAPIKKESTST